MAGGAGTKEAEEEELIRATLRPKQERECERLCSLSFVVLELATTHATLTLTRKTTAVGRSRSSH